MSTLLAAMQRMGRNPPPVMMTHPDDALAMVRSAMLVGAAFPQLRAQAEALSTQLQQIVEIRAKIAAEEEKLRVTTKRYTEESATLATLVDQRNKAARDTQKELELVQQASAEIRRSVSDLGELITRMDKAVTERTRLGAYERELAAAEAAKAATPPGATAAAPPAPAALPTPSEVPARPVTTEPVRQPTGEGKVAVASPPPPPAVPKAPARPPEERPAFTLAPGERTAMASPGRMQPLIPFHLAKGKLPPPAQGKRVLSFGERTQRGKFEGIAIETRHGAQVTAPCDGWVLYAGEFRTYGQLLIINGGGGYLVILSNLAQVDVPVGQFVVAGEPIGAMQAAPRNVQAGRAPENPPVLYVEFRKDQQPINPDPWWIEPGRRNAQAPEASAAPQFALAPATGVRNP
jgi:septal ring factor EnvC (AmiA/AmiB activator)